MRTKTVKRYYCDHCSKGMFKKPSMADHELSCVKNPTRICPLCDRRWDAEDVKKGNELLLTSEVSTYPNTCTSNFEVPADLRAHFDYCPACILSAIVQFPQDKDPENYMHFDFDYKKEKAEHDHEEMMTWGAGLGGTGFQ